MYNFQTSRGWTDKTDVICDSRKVDIESFSFDTYVAME